MLRDEVLALLKGRGGEPLSGQAVSQELGVSRAAVWKAVEALRQEGYVISSAPNRGYALEQSPDRVSAGELAGALAGRLLGRNLVCLESVDSTNNEAKRRAMGRESDGLAVVALEQTGGRGRRGRSFAAAAAALTALFFLIGYLSLVRRIKARTLWKNSLLRHLFRLLGKGLKSLKNFLGIYSKNTSAKLKMSAIVIIFLGMQFLFCAIIFSGGTGFLLLLAFFDAAALVYLIRRAGGWDIILDGLKRISGGELQHKIPTERLLGDQKTMAEYINNIGSGLDAAVEKSVKNERMKTELITNVSHDIKTPLTSIINYVDLLKRENPTDPKIQGYLKILEEKSQRLKTLTEDVVEASKASSGNITLEMNDLDFVEMVQQVIGEFEERFQEKNLVMMVHFTDEPSVIYADGQRMWRVLENIFGNVVKYAMEGTRVYAEVLKADKKITFSLKNISAQPLNISPEELTERFIRGDVSRNTEGSGLGLSIAKSLTELQGGEFKLYLDGDLFKVMITFAARTEKTQI